MRAIDLIVVRHSVFRTRLTFDIDRGYVQQSIITDKPNGQRFYSVRFSTVQNEDEFNAMNVEEHFMSIDDNVFQCHFIRCGHTDSDTLKQDDGIVFIFHHAIFDASSADLFLEEFAVAYSGVYDLQEKPALQYIDYAEHERSTIDMSEAKEYWREILKGYSWDCQLDLPYDFGVPTSARRSGRGWCIYNYMPQEIAHAMMARAQELDVTLMQLALTCFYIFLAQLSPHNQDACLAIQNRNRYRPELENMIGMFLNPLPCRVTFDTSSSSSVTFIDLLHQVQQNLMNMIKHAHMPYLELLDLHRVPCSNLWFPFIQITFIVNVMSDYQHIGKELKLVSPAAGEDCCSLSQYSTKYNPEDEKNYTFSDDYDMSIVITADLFNKNMTLNWFYSTDLFTCSTVNMMLEGFIHLLDDLFVATSSTQLKVTPLVKLIPMANKPINSGTLHQQVCISRLGTVVYIARYILGTIKSNDKTTDTAGRTYSKCVLLYSRHK